MAKQSDIETVTLTLDNNEDIQCEVLVVFEVNKKEYIAVAPVTDNPNEEREAWIYRFKRDKSGKNNHDLINIMDDDEYECALDKFEEWLDSLEYDFDADEVIE